MERTNTKADLHVHSKYSTRPSEWVLQKIGCAESYTEPMHIYNSALGRGMDLVTITDHNTIAGSLEIAHLDRSFISEEITTYFPQTGCKAHVLAYGITESQHADISRIRESVYDLVIYLNREGIVHALAHPLYSPNDRLNVEFFEQLLVLFQIFEVNGARDKYQNDLLVGILESLTRKDIEILADKHGIEPPKPSSWEKILIGGSDDHSSLTIAETYTEMEGIASPLEFLAGIRQKKTTLHGNGSDPKTLAHNLYSIAYQFYNNKFRLSRYANKDLLAGFIDKILAAEPEPEENLVQRLRTLIGYRLPGTFTRPVPHSLKGILQKEAREIISGDAFMSEVIKCSKRNPRNMQVAWFRFVNKISERVLIQFADSFLDKLSKANLFDIFQTIGSATALYTMLAPFFVSYTVLTKDRTFCHRCFQTIAKKDQIGSDVEINLAHFTDTFDDVNGVAETLRMQIQVARKHNKSLTMVTCGSKTNLEGVMNFEPIGAYEMPEYPGMQLVYPPLLNMLDYCYEQNFTHIHAATPGPMGLAALAVARILKLPIHSTYHTALPQYVSILTNDSTMENLAWKYVVWFYNQMDHIFVPSMAIGKELAAQGVQKEKIRFYPRGIDTGRFHPMKRNGFFAGHLPTSDGNDIKLLYVGRVSREKNLPWLVEVFLKLTQKNPRIRLVVIGEGPYLSEMKEALRTAPALFMGFLDGEELAQAYASSDIFIFPSTTDTFGNVVLEAQASGLPVVVTDAGGPQENLIPGETGIVVPANDSNAFLEAVARMVDDRELRGRMSRNARVYMEKRSFEAAYLELWDIYRTLPSPDTKTNSSPAQPFSPFPGSTDQMWQYQA